VAEPWLLPALQLGDSFFPSGAFAHSHGLEELVAAGRVRDAGDLAELLRAHLSERLAHADLRALLGAHAAAGGGDVGGLIEIDRRLTSVKLAREERAASERTGARLAAEAARLTGDDLARAWAEAVAQGRTPGNSAVSLAVAARALGVPARQAALVACHAFSVSLVSAALRLLRLGHGDAQAVLRGCHASMVEAVEVAGSASAFDLQPFGPEIEVAAARHERVAVRLFAS
jgi:urease accessory protein